jgi:hypothetical protein
MSRTAQVDGALAELESVEPGHAQQLRRLITDGVASTAATMMIPDALQGVCTLLKLRHGLCVRYAHTV